MNVTALRQEGGVDEPRVVDRESGTLLVDADLAQVRGLHVPVQDRYVIFLAGAVVADGEGFHVHT
jgi:hypothetical protein